MDFKSAFLNCGIENLKTGVYACACGKTHAIETTVRFGADAVNSVCETVEEIAGKYIKIAVVSDSIVWDLAGKQIHDALVAGGYRCVSKVYRARISPSVLNAETVKEALSEDTKVIVGIGGGSVCDIVKFNATKYKLPSVFIATAPSQCGYLSTIASLTNFGLPETFIVRPPDALVCDLSIINSAPAQLFAGGFGELMSSCSALLDWYASRIIKGEDYCAQTAEIANRLIEEAEEAGEGLLKDEPNAKAKLFENMLKLSALCQASLSSRLINSAANQCGQVLSLLKERQNTACRLHGENAFLFAKVLLKVYGGFLKNKTIHAMPPPDNVTRLEKISSVFNVEEIVAASKMSPLPNAEEYQLSCHKISEYREDLIALALKSEETLARATKIFARLYADAGFWIGRYLSPDDIKTVLSLTPDMSARYTFLSFLKDMGYLEQFL